MVVPGPAVQGERQRAITTAETEPAGLMVVLAAAAAPMERSVRRFRSVRRRAVTGGLAAMVVASVAMAPVVERADTVWC
jgi:hypothetical protein